MLNAQFQKFIHSKVLQTSNYEHDAQEAREDFRQYPNMEAQSFKDLIIQNMDSIERYIIQECKVQEVKVADASLRDTYSSRFITDNRNAHSLENDCSNTGIDQSSKKQSITSSNESNEVAYTAEYNVFAVETQHTEQHEFHNDISLMEKVDSNTTPDASDMCNNEFKDNQNDYDHEDERVMLANLIAILKLDSDENKKIQKKLRKANDALTYELNECKSALVVSNDIRDRCRSALHQKEVELEKYTNYKIVNLKKKRSNYVQTIHMLAPNPSSYYNGRAIFVNPNYLKKAQSEKPCLYNVSFDKDDLANIFVPNSEETLLLEKDNLLMPLAEKTRVNASEFKKVRNQEMFEDLQYVQSLEKELDVLQSDKNEFSNEYDPLLQEYISKDITCAILCSLADILKFNVYTLKKIEECECLVNELSK
ncbi:hypothetical protein Tco_1449171 [Tanacetum coccineum]